MRKVTFIILITIITFISCKKEQTPLEKIVGTWVGIEYPETDTAIFLSDNTVRFTGRPGNTTTDFTISEDEIILSPNTVKSFHKYNINNDILTIENLLITTGYEDDGAGNVDFKKIK